MENQTAPPKPDEQLEATEEKWQEQRRKWDKDETERIANWTKWRDELIENPDDAFASENLKETIANLYFWLRAYTYERNCFDIWDKEALTLVFGADIADRTENVLQTRWRATKPVLWSARSTEARGEPPPYEWIYGLMGVSSAACKEGWTKSLSSRDAEIAATLAMIELNGFSPFIADLAESHPTEVSAVIGGEIAAELGVGGKFDHLQSLQNLMHADIKVRRLLISRLIELIQSWPTVDSDEEGPRWAHHLEQVIRILNAAEKKEERDLVASECRRRLGASPGGALALQWLKGLFRFDAAAGTQWLIGSLSNPEKKETRARAIEWFATIFVDRDAVALQFKDSNQRAKALGQLVRFAYRCIRPKDDQVHDRVYSPNSRDHAERARNFLLGLLVDTPGAEAYNTILALADTQEFAHTAGRMRLMARRRAAADAELPRYSCQDVLELDRRYEVPSQDRDGLFEVMMDRLRDLAHDLEHHEFSDRRTVKRITDEPEMQRTLALRIESKANGAYAVSREEEVVDRKHTDIRLSAMGGGHKAVIEVKIADNGWSVNDLERALREQLVGQYLRHSNCKAGCLLLTYHGRKNYWIHPETEQRIHFGQVLEYLRGEARNLEIERMHDVRIEVFGLDLTGS